MAYYFLKKKGDARRTIEFFKLNLESYHESFDAYLNLSDAYMNYSKWDFAIECLNKVLNLDPANQTAKKLLTDLELLKSKVKK